MQMPKDSRHHFYCKSKPKEITESKEVRYSFLTHNFPELDEETVKRLYLEEFYSLPDFKREHGIGYTQTKFLLEYYDIKTRNISQSTLLDKTRNKYKATCLKNFGAEHNLAKGTEGYEKRNRTVRERYGVDNIFQTEKVKKQIADDSLWIEKYGHTLREHRGLKSKEVWTALNDEQKTKWLDNSIRSDSCRTNCKGPHSKLETRVAQVLDSQSIQYERNFVIKYNKGKNHYHYDFMIKSLNVIIEVNGDFWHANSKKYNKEQEVNYPAGFVKARDIWKKDFKKTKKAVNNGHKIVFIWEDEMKYMSEDQLRSLLFERLGIS